jgi:flagellar hook-length control protein FliK
VEPVKESVDSRALSADSEAPKVLPKGDAKAVGTLAPLNAPASIAATAKAEVAALPPAPNSATAQLEGGVKWMLRAGAPEAQLQLHPENLGQVSIQLKVEGGAVHAKLWVSEPGSMQILQDGRAHLELSLRQQGLQLGSFDLQQGRQPQGGGSFGPAATGASFQSDPAGTQSEPALAAAASPLPTRRIELIA